ncbi:hypothetical protein GALMADRAFT_256659 [Galerina marginata CBS 339.88]|uniref:Uncharacterized protein n=1 Tax=Galerina marginata (strain CBS 339.88) TaxID=685588 RepID=A0A067SM51_GALM3|nr:hypothetical protein GALMADRAFT_256659 [Galerina marginata CBS 339.88]
MFVAAGAAALPGRLITVNDSTTPLWFFCAQINPFSHCNQGMVFSVNAPSDQTFAQFQAAAKAAGGQTGPVTPTTDSNPFSSSSSFSSISSTTAAPTDSTAPTTTASVSTPVESITTPTPTTSGPSSTSARSGDSNGQTTNKSKNIGPIVGGIVGGLMIIALAIASCIYQQRRKRLRKLVDLDLAADSDSPLVVPFRSRPFRTVKRSPPSNTDISPRMVMHEDSGVRLPPIGERFAPVVDVPPRYTSG